jgi:ABC-type sugar transport system ATPase subunit
MMRKGDLQQVADQRELHERPKNLFVASFIGSPTMNLIKVRKSGAR